MTCGEGVETRRRILEQPLFRGKECDVGEMEETRPCTFKLEECPSNTHLLKGITNDHYYLFGITRLLMNHLGLLLGLTAVSSVTCGILGIVMGRR